jgi:pimeloyl-ACP methyl ester carboxylesterase
VSELEYTLIFVHGAGSSADFWHLQQVAFPLAYYVNLPGHVGREPGATSKEPLEELSSIVHRPSSIAGYADGLAEYIECNGLERVVLAGHSMGGSVALELALRQPDWLGGLVLTCAGARYPVSARLVELLREDYETAVDFILAQSFAPHEGALMYKQRAVRYGTRRQMLRTPPEVVMSDYEACAEFDVKDRLTEINAPTLVIAGGEDRLTPPTLSRELHMGIKGSRLVIVEGAGHMLPMEWPDEYNGAVQRFLANQ